MYVLSSPLGHPAQRHLIKNSELISISRLRLQSETIEDAAKMSLVYLLIKGEAPTTIQRAFNNLCTTTLSTFKKENPEYTFKRCGARRKDEPKPPAKPKRPRGRPRKE